jgi:hypothetical protein
MSEMARAEWGGSYLKEEEEWSKPEILCREQRTG